jgi:hypothetical protein
MSITGGAESFQTAGRCTLQGTPVERGQILNPLYLRIVFTPGFVTAESCMASPELCS